MMESGREALKSLARAVAVVAILPCLLSFQVRALVLGRDRSLEGSSQALSLIPGLIGRYVRQAFLARTLDECDPTAVIEFGTIFSQTGARIGERVYIGPRCHLGLVHIEPYALLAAGVHVPSGAHTHGHQADGPIQLQPMNRKLVHIGSGSWVGSGAVVMADIGKNTIVGAGAVVTHPVPDSVIAAGVPAKVLRQRS
jgi:acetyltransferase-like isoleucine patch superfamily enzyme